MDNFCHAIGMKNAMDLEDLELDLSLSLRCGTQKRTTHSYSPSLPQINHELDLTLSLRCGTPKRTTHSSSPSLPQINISLMEPQMPYPNYFVPSSNHSINPNYLVPSSYHSINPNYLVPSSNQNTTNPSLASSSNHNADPLMVLPSNPPGAAAPTPVLRRRSRRASFKRRSQGKRKTIPAPYPWATDRRATVHNLKYLLQNKVVAITGRVQCKWCEQAFEMTLDLEEKVKELGRFIQRERSSMHDRAPVAWVNPVTPKCVHCGQENCTKPILHTKKREINWLFLFLGQMLGFCTLEQLKYFCKHTNNIRTGAKDRSLYVAYMTLNKQLVPEWFD